MEISNALKGRDFISLHDFSAAEIQLMLDTGLELKQNLKQGIMPPVLAGKTLGMIFQKSSTRTRVAFEVGMYQLGGNALFLSPRDIQIGRGESIRDTAMVLSRMLNGIMIRTFSHDEVLELAQWADIPVINGLTDRLHPTQVLADLMTMLEYKGHLKGLKLAFIGDGNNMAHSLLFGCAKMGVDCSVASPIDFSVSGMIYAQARSDAAASGAKLHLCTDPLEAAADADVIYTDVWASMGQEAEAADKEKLFTRYQVNAELMRVAKPDAIVLHCLPAKLDKEITAEVLYGPQSAVFDEAENRLHAHKAIMALVM